MALIGPYDPLPEDYLELLEEGCVLYCERDPDQIGGSPQDLLIATFDEAIIDPFIMEPLT